MWVWGSAWLSVGLWTGQLYLGVKHLWQVGICREGEKGFVDYGMFFKVCMIAWGS